MTFGKKTKAAAAEPVAENSASPAAPEDTKAATDRPEGGATDAKPADAAPVAAAEPPPSPPSEVDLLKDRLLRLQADFDNYRKRIAREHQDTKIRANQELLEALLTPVDHLERAMELLRKELPEGNAFLQGVQLVRTEFLAVLDRFGLKPIEVLGKPFDPSFHEALGWAAVPEVPEGHVAAELRSGYLLNGRLLRAAQVMVAAPAAPPPSGEPASTPTEDRKG